MLNFKSKTEVLKMLYLSPRGARFTKADSPSYKGEPPQKDTQSMPSSFVRQAAHLDCRLDLDYLGKLPAHSLRALSYRLHHAPLFKLPQLGDNHLDRCRYAFSQGVQTEIATSPKTSRYRCIMNEPMCASFMMPDNRKE